MIIIAVILAWLGLCAGSFINALVWRLHQQSKSKKTAELSILKGRSMCEHCRHTLAWYDLIPLVSWLSLKGKCRYCKKPISFESPAIEVIMAVVFAGSYLLWPLTVNQDGQWLLLATWLVSSVGLVALAIYDLKWMLLPSRIIYPTLAVAAAGRLAYIIFYQDRPAHAVLMWAASLLVASGLFYLLYEVSKGKWIGFGDVRLGLITGTLLALPQKSLLMIFIASVIGSLMALPDLIRGKKSLASRLPFGPFLITATWIVVLFGNWMLDRYQSFMGLK